MVSTRLPTSKSSSPFNNPLFTVPKAPFTIGITVIFMFHSFFNSLGRSRYLSFFSHYYYHYYFKIFLPGVFQRSLRQNISPQVSRTHLKILADLNNAVVWMVSNCPLISKSSSHLSKILRPFKPFYLSMYSLCFFTLWSNVKERKKPYKTARSGPLTKNRWSVCILKSLRIQCVSFSITGSRLCKYSLIVLLNLFFFEIHRGT